MRKTKSQKHVRFEKDMLPHTDVLYNYAYYLTGDSDRSQDLLQETYLKAFRFYDKFEQGTNAKAWLYRIMRNTYINEYRRLKRIPDLLEYDEQISAYQMVTPDSRDTNDLRAKIDRQTLNDELATAISSLPEKFKSVVVLRDVEDLPYDEIAEALEIPVGTVRSRLHRARAILFDKLRNYAKDRGYDISERFEATRLAMAG